MEIKLIDLLNKISDYENLPKKIKYKEIIYYYCEGDQRGNCYFTRPKGYGGDWLHFDIADLGKEVEIIESEELTPLEEITYDEFCEMDNQERFEATIKEYAVINSLIKKIKEMEEGK